MLSALQLLPLSPAAEADYARFEDSFPSKRGQGADGRLYLLVKKLPPRER